MGRRLALLVATYQYEDPGLRQLTAPAHDAEALAAVLADPQIAGFEVTTLVNEPHYRVGAAIGDFYRNLRRDDLTLLYFTGHGVKDDMGRLYLALANTRRDSLLFTALSADQIDQAMEGCVSRQKVLILDCCYSGAFPASRLVKGDTEVHSLERFQGRGRTVLTASDATQYAFEGDQPHGSAAQSLFTRYLVAGLRDGSADLDGDGDITLDELYSYVHDRVVEEMPQQRPKKQDNVEGRTVIARNVSWTLPAYLRNALNSPIANDRRTAVDNLAHLCRIGNELVRARIRTELIALVDDDSKRVSAAAEALLQTLTPPMAPAHEEPAPTTIPEPPAATVQPVREEAETVTSVPLSPPDPDPPTTRPAPAEAEAPRAPTVPPVSEESSPPATPVPPAPEVPVAHEEQPEPHDEPVPHEVPVVQELPLVQEEPVLHETPLVHEEQSTAVSAAPPEGHPADPPAVTAGPPQTQSAESLPAVTPEPRQAQRPESPPASVPRPQEAQSPGDTAQDETAMQPDAIDVPHARRAAPEPIRITPGAGEARGPNAVQRHLRRVPQRVWAIAAGLIATSMIALPVVVLKALDGSSSPVSASSGSGRAGPVGAHWTLQGANGVVQMVFSKDDTTLYGMTSDGVVKKWTLSSSQFTTQPTPLSSGKSFKGAVLGPEGRTLAVQKTPAQGNASLSVVETATGEEVGKLSDKVSQFAVAFSPDGGALATANMLAAPTEYDNSIKLWTTTGQATAVLPGLRNGVNTIAFSPDGRLLAAGGVGSIPIIVWDLLTHQQLWHTTTGYVQTKKLAFSKDGTTLAAVVANTESQAAVKVWKAYGGEPGKSFALTDPIDGLGFNFENQVLVFAHNPIATYLRNPDSGVPTQQLMIDPPLTATAVSTDGDRFAVAGAPGIIGVF